VRDPFYGTADRSIAFLSREPSRAEASMATWAVIALLLVLVAILIGAPA
jgi:hypothetical protein